MTFAKANPNEYLVVGRGGKINNRGTGIKILLPPGSLYVVIPSTKQQTAFEMTQETKDGIPLHFKGIVVYRITDPVAAAQNFNFNKGEGLDEISTLIRNICLGELRSTVSGMNMQECIERRKTILTTAVETALVHVLQDAPHSNTPGQGWGIELELVQVAQVYIIDGDMRKLLEAEIRNHIKATSDQSDIRTQEETRLVQIASERRLMEQKLESEKNSLRRKEEIEMTQNASERRMMELKLESEKDSLRRREEIEMKQIAYQRRLQKETLETNREAIRVASEKYKLEQEAEKEKTEIEAPVKLLEIENRQAILLQELKMRQIENQVHELEVAHEVMLDASMQKLRKDILPLEQTPVIAESLSKIFQGADLSFFGNDSQIMSLIAPLFNAFSKMIRESPLDLHPSDDSHK